LLPFHLSELRDCVALISVATSSYARNNNTHLTGLLTSNSPAGLPSLPWPLKGLVISQEGYEASRQLSDASTPFNYIMQRGPFPPS